MASEFGEWPTERLESELSTLAACLTAATARFVALVGELDRREAWLSWECKSAAEWLSWHCGVGLGTARDQVRVARALSELPMLAAAFATGSLSYSKARALVRVATPETEAELVELATHTTAGQLERILAAWRRCRRTDSDDVAAFAERYLRARHDDDGTMKVIVRLATDDGARLMAAIDAAAEILRDQDRAVADAARVSAETPEGLASVSAETPVIWTAVRTIDQRRADALVELVTTGTIGGMALDVGIEVTVDAETLVAHADGVCSIAGKYPISAQTARLLGCDAALTAIITGPNGEVLDVGRRQRTTPRRLRRALQRRDKGCVVDGCPRDGHLHAHHVVFWGAGGATSLDNLVLLCSFHHRLVHQGELVVELVEGKPVCRKGDRSPRVTRIPPPIDHDGALRELERLGVPVELNVQRADGERLDWDSAFAALSSLFDLAGARRGR